MNGPGRFVAGFAGDEIAARHRPKTTQHLARWHQCFDTPQINGAKCLGECYERDLSRLRLMRIMSHLREAMWGIVQIRLSKLDYDCLGYAKQFFERMRLEVNNQRYPQWLKTAAAVK